MTERSKLPDISSSSRPWTASSRERPSILRYRPSSDLPPSSKKGRCCGFRARRMAESPSTFGRRSPRRAEAAGSAAAHWASKCAQAWLTRITEAEAKQIVRNFGSGRERVEHVCPPLQETCKIIRGLDLQIGEPMVGLGAKLTAAHLRAFAKQIAEVDEKAKNETAPHYRKVLDQFPNDPGVFAALSSANIIQFRASAVRRERRGLTRANPPSYHPSGWHISCSGHRRKVPGRIRSQSARISFRFVWPSARSRAD